jgi:hypothetical protein
LRREARYLRGTEAKTIALANEVDFRGLSHQLTRERQIRRDGAVVELGPTGTQQAHALRLKVWLDI